MMWKHRWKGCFTWFVICLFHFIDVTKWKFLGVKMFQGSCQRLGQNLNWSPDNRRPAKYCVSRNFTEIYFPKFGSDRHFQVFIFVIIQKKFESYFTEYCTYYKNYYFEGCMKKFASAINYTIAICFLSITACTTSSKKTKSFRFCSSWCPGKLHA